MYKKNTKIVCTLGPSSDSISEITKMVNAGMNVARLNFSHGTYEHHAMMIKNIHKVEKKTGTTIAILQDLQGPKIRLGELPKKGIELKKGEYFKLTIRRIEGKKTEKETTIPIQYRGIVKDTKKGDIILINDGLFEAQVVKCNKSSLICVTKTDGKLSTRNGVNLTTGSISAKTITKKDREDLIFGLKHNVDYVALSFVKSKKDIDDLRKLIKAQRKNTKIIAKVERHEAVNNLKQIILAADAIMVARGDLGIDIPAEEVPIVQKRMIALANKYGKPTITATQVLQSMVDKPRATRAEISDAANAIFDHTDAIMLSNETAIGKYPIRAVTTLCKVATTVEKNLQKHGELREHIEKQKYMSPINATCENACDIAKDTKADFIVAYTIDGYTARQIAKHRTYTETITICPDKNVTRELSLVWGLNHNLHKKIAKKGTEKTSAIVNYLKKKKMIKKNDKIVIVCNASRQEKLISTYKV